MEQQWRKGGSQHHTIIQGVLGWTFTGLATLSTIYTIQNANTIHNSSWRYLDKGGGGVFAWIKVVVFP